MKKKSLTLLLATTVASSILFSSCIGSFGLTNKLLTWNRSIDSKFVNELVFIAFWIVPVYEISALADVLVINSIEFWSGSNPVADVGNVKTIDGKDGVYTVDTHRFQRMFDKSLCHLGNVHQTVLMYTDIYKCTEINNITDSSLQHHSFFQIFHFKNV